MAIHDIWALLRSKLPRDKTPEQLEARKKLFRCFDPNGNGYLSVAEVHAGCLNILGLGQLTKDLQPIILRAHAHAKAAHKRTNPKPVPGRTNPDDYVEFAEFRVLLVYIYNYFELWAMFSQIDTSGDRRVELSEFKQALPLIEGWGKKIADVEKTFKEIDTNGGGYILFDEFADWAIKQQLDMDGDVSNLL